MNNSDDETDDGLTEYQRMCNQLESKKMQLLERKKRYSELTSIQFGANQELHRMKKALKNQTSAINNATKKYVDNNVKLALAEADCEYFENNLSSHGVGFDQKQELAAIGMSREHLQDKLNEYRDLKDQINEQGNKFSTQNQSLRQECLNVGFFCGDIRTKVETEIKKALDRHHFEPNNASKNHLRNANKSAMMVANRVLECREEVLGFFKQQLMKVKREERIAQEERELQEERNNLNVNSQAHTESEMESFVKKQRVLHTNDENSDENADDIENLPSRHKQPHPPSKESPSAALAHMVNNLKSGRGNFVAGTARQKRKDRNSPFAAVNIDRIGDDLIHGCETEGNIFKLRALKSAMQNHILYQLSLLLLLENELKSEKLFAEQIRKESADGESLISLLSDLKKGEAELEKGERKQSISKKQKQNVGQFGASIGKLCGISSASVENDEHYVRFCTPYLKSLAAEVAEVEVDLLKSSETYEKVLYNTCVDGIKEPYVSPDVRSDTDEVKKGDKLISRTASNGYRAQTMIALQSRVPMYPEEERIQRKRAGSDEKSFGLKQWLDDGNFEDKLAQILTSEVKSMNDIPIELGLAKVTSINLTSQQAATAHMKHFKERERQTMNLAMTNPGAAAAAINNQNMPAVKKILIKGLENL